MSRLLEGKVAVVTGAGRGIGQAIAIGLSAAGAKVVVNDIGAALDGLGSSRAPAEDVVAAIRSNGGEAITCFDTVSTMAGGARIVQAALDQWGRLDVLVCAAGNVRAKTIFEMTESDWDDVIDTHLKGHFTTMKPACIQMKKQQAGCIITITSSGGLEGNPNQPNYSAAKEGIIGLTRAVALTIAPYANCNSIWPMGKTRMTDLMAPTTAKPAPESVSPLVVFLASDAARHITGQVINIGGDRVALFPQPRPVRTAIRPGGWTAEDLAGVWEGSIGIDPLVRLQASTGEVGAKASA